MSNALTIVLTVKTRLKTCERSPFSVTGKHPPALNRVDDSYGIEKGAPLSTRMQFTFYRRMIEPSRL